MHIGIYWIILWLLLLLLLHIIYYYYYDCSYIMAIFHGWKTRDPCLRSKAIFGVPRGCLFGGGRRLRRKMKHGLLANSPPVEKRQNPIKSPFLWYVFHIFSIFLWRIFVCYVWYPEGIPKPSDFMKDFHVRVKAGSGISGHHFHWQFRASMSF
jgi:hypothetical protein